MVLEPGEYEFVVDTTSATRIVTVTSKSTGWSGMILASAIGDTRMSGASSSLTLANSERCQVREDVVFERRRRRSGVFGAESNGKALPKLRHTR